jgi:hypothetical protein
MSNIKMKDRDGRISLHNLCVSDCSIVCSRTLNSALILKHEEVYEGVVSLS